MYLVPSLSFDQSKQLDSPNGKITPAVLFRGGQSLKFLTPTPLLLRLNIPRLHSDSENF